MSRSLRIPILLASCTMGMLCWQWVRWRSADGSLASSERSLRLARADAAELSRLRSTQESTLYGEPPAEDVLARVSAVLGAIGLPSSVATNIAREADRAASDDGRVRRRDMRIELRPIEVADLGRFLAAWNDENPAWSVRQVSIRKNNDRRGGPLDYQAQLTCSAEYTANGANP